MNARAAHAPRSRRPRSATESLLSIALILEAMLIFFVALVVFGLKVLPANIAIGGGVLFIILLCLAARSVGTQWGVWLGWVLQAAMIATGALLPLMYFIGAGFLGVWIYCFVMGRRLDKHKAEYLAANPTPKETT